MNITLSNINWLVVVPLGFIALFFGTLGLRRSIRFFNHESNASQRERFRDLFLSTFALGTMVFSFLIAMSPTELWLVMIPIGIGMLIFTVPISILGSYYQLHVAIGFMPRNAGFKIPSAAPSEKTDESIAWYEFTPFAFVLGWLMFFIVNAAFLSVGWLTIGTAQELSGFSMIIGIIIGILTAVVVIVGVFLKLKTG